MSAQALQADSRIIDLNGCTIVPGFIDTHPHLLHFGTLAEPLVNLGDARSLAGIADRIAARAARVPPGEWIMTTPAGEPHLPHPQFLPRSPPCSPRMTRQSDFR